MKFTIDIGFLMFCSKVDPAVIRLEVGDAGLGVELAARLVERRHVRVAATGDVERRQVEREAEQVVAQSVDDELVDLVADAADMPRMIAPVASRRSRSGAPLRVKACGLRKASIRPMLRPSVAVDRVQDRFSRSIVSVSIEWPKR